MAIGACIGRVVGIGMEQLALYVELIIVVIQKFFWDKLFLNNHSNTYTLVKTSLRKDTLFSHASYTFLLNKTSNN